jgi:ABC-2 type transport system ATP-binding protein
MLTVSRFEKKYGDSLILSFEKATFDTGISWIRGENGSGKSTFFKAISGLIPFSGSASFPDIDLRDKPVQFRKHVNFAEAEPLFPGFLSGREIFMFVANARNTPPEEVRYYQKLLGIDQFFHKTCDTYSSGMLKKMSLSISFLGHPRVIILDEPLITLDQGSCDILLAEIKQCVLKQGKIFLLSSHQAMDDSLPGVSSYIIKNKTLSQA